MKLNYEKSNYMIFNFSQECQLNTCLYMDQKLLSQVKETCLLGVKITDDLKWHKNTASLINRCYQRMLILRNLNTFHVPKEEMINIYCLYIRSVAEQSSVVWSSSITSGESNDLERIPKLPWGFSYKVNTQTITMHLKSQTYRHLKQEDHS